MVRVRDKEAEKTRTVSVLIVDGIVVADDDSVSDAQFARRDILRLSVRNNRSSLFLLYSFIFTFKLFTFLHGMLRPPLPSTFPFHHPLFFLFPNYHAQGKLRDWIILSESRIFRPRQRNKYTCLLEIYLPLAY